MAITVINSHVNSHLLVDMENPPKWDIPIYNQFNDFPMSIPIPVDFPWHLMTMCVLQACSWREYEYILPTQLAQPLEGPTCSKVSPRFPANGSAKQHFALGYGMGICGNISMFVIYVVTLHK